MFVSESQCATCACGGQWTLLWSCLSPPTVMWLLGLHGSNSHCHSCIEALFSTEPSCLPYIPFFKVLFYVYLVCMDILSVNHSCVPCALGRPEEGVRSPAARIRDSFDLDSGNPTSFCVYFFLRVSYSLNWPKTLCVGPWTRLHSLKS